MSVREYIGARYVPVFAEPAEWDATRTYEPLTVVMYQGNSYTSRQAVPANIPITNTTYWAQTGNYNAQVEQYRQEVATFDGRIEELEDTVSPYTSSSTIQSAINAEATARQSADSGLQTAINNEASARQSADNTINAKLNNVAAASFALAIGNSWVSNERPSSYGPLLTNWMNNLYGYDLRCYGKSGAGWLTPSPSNHLIEESVTEAISANSADALSCTDIILVEMQNDHSLFGSTSNPSGYVAKMQQQINRLKTAFPKAKFHYVADCHGTLVTPTEYYNFIAMLIDNFAMPIYMTPFLFDTRGYLDEGHLANNKYGYGAFAKLIYGMISGGKVHYHPVILSAPSGITGLNSGTFYVVGDPIFERNCTFTASFSLQKAESNNPTTISVTPTHVTGVNWAVIANMTGGCYGYTNLMYGNVHAAQTSVKLEGDGTIKIVNGPEAWNDMATGANSRTLASQNVNYKFQALA